MEIIKIKDVKQAIHITMLLLEKLNEIYHALKDAREE